MKVHYSFGSLVWAVWLFVAGSYASVASDWSFITRAKVDTPPLRQAMPLQLEPGLNGTMEYMPRWECSCTEALKTDSIYLLTVRARAVNLKPGGSAALKVALTSRHEERGRFRPVFSCGPVLSPKWETFKAPFSVKKDVPPGSLSFFLVHGWGDAAIEVEDIRIESLGSDKPLQAYSRTGRWYDGQEADATWREEAENMIATNRMAAMSVQVVDDQGEPLENVRVIIEQQRHAYRFGTAVNTRLWRWMTPEAASNSQLQAEFEHYRSTSGRTELTFAQGQTEARKYFDVLKSDFNYVVFENALKWKAWSGEWDSFRREDTLRLIDWLRANGMEVKGHAFVWPSWNHSPDWTKSMADRPDELNRLVHAHITDLGAAVNGKVVEFDVMNEAFNNHDFMDVMGNDVITGWFEQARNVLPDAQLNVNDFLLMANGGRWTEKLDFYDNLVEGLLAKQAPLGGIGFQCHFRHSFLTGPRRIWELCDRFGRHGLPLICSEFDVNLADEELQAAYTRDFLTAWFAHPDTQSFVQWGFWQGSHWLPYAGLYDRDWRMKPNAMAYRDLVYGDWWSGREEARTDKTGKVNLRGFLGEYRVTIHANGREAVLDNITLKKTGTSLSIRI